MANLPDFFRFHWGRTVEDMQFDQASLEELKALCAEFYQRQLTDAEAQDVGQRIVRFLKNSETSSPAGGSIDAD